jgi:hypothetical protein
VIAEQQKLIDGRKMVACCTVTSATKPWNASKHPSFTNNRNVPSFNVTSTPSHEH